MPSNTDYLSELARYNERNNITATFSEMKKTARRIERICTEHEAARNAVDPLAYVLQFWDETGELATDNVMAERAEQNRANAARRVAA
jgi:hypothetical protein